MPMKSRKQRRRDERLAAVGHGLGSFTHAARGASPGRRMRPWPAAEERVPLVLEREFARDGGAHPRARSSPATSGTGGKTVLAYSASSHRERSPQLGQCVPGLVVAEHDPLPVKHWEATMPAPPASVSSANADEAGFDAECSSTPKARRIAPGCAVVIARSLAALMPGTISTAINSGARRRSSSSTR